MARMDVINEPRQYRVGALNAAICGSDAASDAVARFDALGTQVSGIYPVNAAGNWILQTNSATAGTTFKMGLRGAYKCDFTVNCVGAAGPVVVIGAVSIDADAATMAGAVTNASVGVKGIAQFSQIEAITCALGPIHGTCLVTDDDSGQAARAIIRVLLTDEAGATPPDADVVQASAFLMITRVADIMGRVA